MRFNLHFGRMQRLTCRVISAPQFIAVFRSCDWKHTLIAAWWTSFGDTAEFLANLASSSTLHLLTYLYRSMQERHSKTLQLINTVRQSACHSHLLADPGAGSFFLESGPLSVGVCQNACFNLLLKCYSMLLRIRILTERHTKPHKTLSIASGTFQLQYITIMRALFPTC